MNNLLYDYAKSFLGLPYKWGGDDPLQGFDCSGLILELLWSRGLPPHTDTTAQNIFNYWAERGYSKRSPQFGTLAFFGKDYQHITHVGFCLNSYLMIEAGGGGSRTNTLQDASNQNAYIRQRPIAHRRDIAAYALPPWPRLDEITESLSSVPHQ